MRQKILDKPLAKPFDKSFQQRLEKVVVAWEKKFQDKRTISHKWNAQGNKLTIQSDPVVGKIVFSKDRVKVMADMPFYLLPVVEPFRAQVIKMIEETLAAVTSKSGDSARVSFRGVPC
ncbi:MAG: polyhydroxyalkanoic acid system family protein [Verrucomicrobia bacterium]|nr:polyhydroxyalkanoic acid system family protein [Verrucomicrobiota bacterium]